MRLKPDSIADSVLIFDKKEEANIGTIKKMLNENPENPEILCKYQHLLHNIVVAFSEHPQRYVSYLFEINVL